MKDYQCMQHHGWILKTLCWGKRERHKGPYGMIPFMCKSVKEIKFYVEWQKADSWLDARGEGE